MTGAIVLAVTALSHIVVFLGGAYAYYRLISKAIGAKEES